MISLRNRQTRAHVSSPLKILGKSVFPEYSLLPVLLRRCQVLRQPMPEIRLYHAVGKRQRLRRRRRRSEWLATVPLSKQSKPALIKVPHDAEEMWKQTLCVQVVQKKIQRYDEILREGEKESVLVQPLHSSALLKERLRYNGIVRQ